MRSDKGQRWLPLVLAVLLFAEGMAGAQSFATTVRGSNLRDDAAAASQIDLGLPGEPGAPSAYKTSLAQVLVGQPGVQLRSAGGLGQWSGAILRGADASQVAILLDGVPLQRGGQSAVDLSQLPVDGIERVEIYRSLPPIEVGLDAIGGAINLISRRGRSGRSSFLVLGAGSFGLRKLSAGHSSESAAGLRAAATLSYQGATGDFPYLSDGGLQYAGRLVELVRRNDDFDQLSVDVRVSREDTGGGFFVASHSLLKTQGVAGIGQAAAQPGQPRLQLGRALLSAGAQRAWRDGRLRLSSDAHVLFEGSQLGDLAIVPAANYEQLGLQAGLRGLLSLAGRAQSKLGLPLRRWLLMLDGRYERATSSDLCPAPRRDCGRATPTSSQRLRLQLGAGGELRFADELLLVQPAVHLLLARSSLRPLSGSPAADESFDGDALFVAPRVATRLRLSRAVLLRFGGGRFVRLPTFLELFGDRAFFRPNLELRPESAWIFELGGRMETTPRPFLNLQLEAHAFARQIDDLIDVIRDGATLRARNVGQAVAAGAEAQLSLRLGELLQLQATYTFLHARDEADVPGRGGNRLPGRPAHTFFLRSEVAYRTVRLAYELDYRSAIFLDPANGRERPERLLHALALHSGPFGRTHVTLSIEVRNLTDLRSVDVILPLGDRSPRPLPLSDLFDYPLPGRALYGTLSGRF